MNWKIFITVSISTAIVFFPQNIIGCGPGTDPYDYYISFFHQNLPDAKGYKPFYYTGYNFLYDENEPAEVADLLAVEWATYCGKPVGAGDAKLFVNKFSREDEYKLYLKIEKNTTEKIPDSVLKNSMANYFISSKNLEGLGYILYAKQVEPFVTGVADSWEPVKRDSAKMAGLIKNGQQLFTAAKDDFIKLKYGYQIVRLAQYSRRFDDAIKFYNDYVSANKVSSILQPLAVSLKAGALNGLGNKKQAAYLYSKSFSASVAKRVSNYISFRWMVDVKADRNDYLSVCKNNKEKAAMLGLFALGSPDNELTALKDIYTLDAGNNELEVLVVREINKLEERYFTPALQKQKGGRTFYFSWNEGPADSIMEVAKKEIEAFTGFLSEAAKNKQVQNAGLCQTAAAYLAYMVKDYAKAKKYLVAAKNMSLTPKVKDQWMLTDLLISINEMVKIDAASEERLLPFVEWLEAKAKNEKPSGTGYYEVSQWKQFYRNLMTEIIARRYHQQGDIAKEALVIGAADLISSNNDYYNYGNGIVFLHNNLDVPDIEKLYALMNNKQNNKFENYILNHTTITRAAVIDFAGTAYLRAYDYTKAIAWFKKQTDKKSLSVNTNPFVDLLYDQEEALPSEIKFITTKLAFAEEMQKQLLLTVSDKANAAKHYYKIANGMYNITYYGHAWKLVQYDRSGSDGYYIPDNATSFQKEYYGCYSALQYFKKAMEASASDNFKARCLFMMAKCSQKQVQKPGYASFNYDWAKLNTAEKAYWPRFTENIYFPQLIKQYSKTVFYQEVFNSCSYLSDFVAAKK
jgi:hypothetical protein